MIRYPTPIERRYGRYLARRLRVARALLAAQTHHDALTPEEAAVVAAIVRRARAAFESAMPPPDGPVTLTGTAVQSWAETTGTAEVERVLRLTAGETALATSASDRQLLKTQWIRENTAAIKALEDKLWTSLVSQAVEEGLSQAIAARFKVAENEARLLARDQIGTLQGQMQRSVQTAHGLDRYEWSSMDDGHVRPRHRALDGDLLQWDDPVPGEGHPGEAFGCRCVAQPRGDESKLDLRKLAELNLFPGVRDWRAQLARIFGRPVSAAEILEWAGFRQQDLNGARVTMNLRPDGRVVLEADAQKFGLARIYRPGAAFHDSLGVKETGQGFGSALFARQAAALRSAGFQSIELNAGGYPGGSSNGYYTWPRLGFDGPLRQSTIAQLPPELAGATRVSDLMLTEAGRDWWRAHGVAMDLTFDLSPGSLSSRLLAAYLQERAGRVDDRRADATGPEEIRLSPSEEAALDRAWARVGRTVA